MKKTTVNSYITLILSIIILSCFFIGCKKEENPIKFPQGIFPDSVITLAALNSPFDDYNLDIYILSGGSSLVFSSNRSSSGGQFDLVQGTLDFTFDQTNGDFQIQAAISNDAFINKLINKTQTTGNDFGPYRLFSSLDGFDYMIVSSVNQQGNLDLYYLKNRPIFGSSLPDIEGPLPVTLFNTPSDDAYFCFDTNMDSAYFTSNRNGSFDIFLHKRPATMEISKWLNLEFAASTPVDSLNSTGNDKCPMVFKKLIIFASDRPGGLGGFDLYYSVFRKSKWSAPVNFGPGINTSSDEYRPVIGYHQDFKNYFLMFSSSRPGGKGGFDLYFTGINIPEK